MILFVVGICAITAVGVATCVAIFRCERQTYYFRGTSRGFPGGPNAQKYTATSASLDPLVATNFAAHSRSFGGEGVVLVASNYELEGVQALQPEALSELEVEVVFSMLPADFERRATIAIPVDVAVFVLRAMGFEVNRYITSHVQLSFELNMSRERGDRLDASDLRDFIRRATKEMDK